MNKINTIDRYIHNQKLMLNKYNIKREIIEYDYSAIKLYDLKSVYIQFLDLTDELVENISATNSLEGISIGNAQIVTNKRFKNDFSWILLSNMPSEIYNLFDNKESTKLLTIDSAEKLDINNILGFKNIEEIIIYNSNVINVSKLYGLKSLERISIYGGNIDDEAFVKIAKNNLEIIYEKDYAKANELPKGM